MNLFTIEYDEAKDDIKITHSNKLRETLADVLGVEKSSLSQLVMVT